MKFLGIWKACHNDLQNLWKHAGEFVILLLHDIVVLESIICSVFKHICNAIWSDIDLNSKFEWKTKSAEEQNFWWFWVFSPSTNVPSKLHSLSRLEFGQLWMRLKSKNEGPKCLDKIYIIFLPCFFFASLFCGIVSNHMGKWLLTLILDIKWHNANVFGLIFKARSSLICLTALS